MYRVALVGRMNVGKSTLFNRLSVAVKSITLDYAGVTRDVLRDTIEWAGKKFELVDTGGISLRKSTDAIAEKVRQQALLTLDQSDIVIFVLDGTVGVTPEDYDIAAYLRKLNKPIIIACNKSDAHVSQDHKAEFYGLGFNHTIMLSAQHGTGIADLLETLVNLIPAQELPEEVTPSHRVMLLGRPNVGKSSLMNLLLKQERSIVSDIAGTTREAISEPITFYQEHLLLTDTPGVRRPKNITSDIESLMVKSAFKSLKDADVMLLLIDASEGKLVHQDLKLGFYAFTEQHKALIILINKTDLATEEDKESLQRSLDAYRHVLKKVPVLSISCKTGKNIARIMPLIQTIWQRYNMKFSDSELTTLFLKELSERPLVKCEHMLQVYAAQQIKTKPITILLKVNNPIWFGPSQLAFFENILRKSYDLVGVPVRFVTRSKKEAREQSPSQPSEL